MYHSCQNLGEITCAGLHRSNLLTYTNTTPTSYDPPVYMLPPDPSPDPTPDPNTDPFPVPPPTTTPSASPPGPYLYMNL